jgi:hypothetical protein
MKTQGWSTLALATMLGVLAALGVAIGTGSGIGTLNDSSYYFSAANNLASGRRLQVDITPLKLPAWSDDFAAWPPLYPILLSVGVATGLPVDSSARVVGLGSVIGMSVGLFSLAYLIARDRVIAFIVTVLALTVRPVWVTLHYGLSEPLFMALCFATLAVFASALTYVTGTGQRRRRMWVATMGLSLVMLTRFLGLAFFAAVVAMLFFQRAKRNTLNNSLHSDLIVLLSPVALLTYLLRNWQLTGTLTDAQRSGYPNSLGALGWKAMTGWLPNSPFHLGLTDAFGLATSWFFSGVFVSLLLLTGTIILRGRAQSEYTVRNRYASSTTTLIVVSMATYGSILVALTANGNVNPNDIGRLLASMWPLMAVVTLSWLSIFMQKFRLRSLGIVAISVILVVQLTGAAQFSLAARTGIGFGADPWKGSASLEISEYLAKRVDIPRKMAFFSNFAPAFWFRTRMPVKRIDNVADVKSICKALTELPTESPSFIIVLFSEVNPTISDPLFQQDFERQINTCTTKKLASFPVADGLVVTGALSSNRYVDNLGAIDYAPK